MIWVKGTSRLFSFFLLMDLTLSFPNGLWIPWGFILSCLIRIIISMRAAYLVEWFVLASPLFLFASASVCNCYLCFVVFRLLSCVRLFLTPWPHVCVCVCYLLSRVQLFAPHELYSLPGSFVHGIHQARILDWVAISSSRGSSWLSDWTWVSCILQFLYYWATRETPGHFSRKHLKVP